MKKLIILIIPLVFVLVLIQTGYPQTYYRTYEVAGNTVDIYLHGF